MGKVHQKHSSFALTLCYVIVEDGTREMPIPVSDEREETTPAKRAKRDSTPGNSESRTAGFDTVPDHAALRGWLEREIRKLDGEMRQAQEREDSARAAKEEVEKTARDKHLRLAEIEEQCAALQREASAVNVEVGRLGIERQAAAEEEESCRERCKELQELRDRVAADLCTAAEAEAAQRELREAEERLEQQRQIVEEKSRAAFAAWQRAEQLEQEEQMRIAEEQERAREQAEWEDKCLREAAEAKARQEAKAHADRLTRAQAEADQAESPDEPRTARQRNSRIRDLRSRLEVLIMIVGSGKAIDLLKTSLKKAYKQAAMDTHTDKGK